MGGHIEKETIEDDNVKDLRDSGTESDVHVPNRDKVEDWSCRCGQTVDVNTDNCLRLFEAKVGADYTAELDYEICPRLLGGRSAYLILERCDSLPKLISGVAHCCSNQLSSFNTLAPEDQHATLDKVLNILEFILRNLVDSGHCAYWLGVVEDICQAIFDKIAFITLNVLEHSLSSRFDCYSVWLTFVKRFVVPLVHPYTVGNSEDPNPEAALRVNSGRAIYRICLGHVLVNYIVSNELFCDTRCNGNDWNQSSAFGACSRDRPRRLELDVARLLVDRDWSTRNNQSDLLNLYHILVKPFCEVWTNRDGRGRSFLIETTASDTPAATNSILDVFGSSGERLPAKNGIQRVHSKLGLDKTILPCFAAKHLWITNMRYSSKVEGADDIELAQTRYAEVRASIATSDLLSWYLKVELRTEVLSRFVLHRTSESDFGSYITEWASSLQGRRSEPAAPNGFRELSADTTLSAESIALKCIDQVYTRLTDKAQIPASHNFAVVCKRLTSHVTGGLLGNNCAPRTQQARVAAVVETVLTSFDTKGVSSVPWFVLDTYLSDDEVIYPMPEVVRSGYLLALIFNKYVHYRQSILAFLNTTLHDSALSMSKCESIATSAPSGQQLFMQFMRGLKHVERTEPSAMVSVQFTIMVTDRERELPDLFRCLQTFFDGGLEACTRGSMDTQYHVRSKRLRVHSIDVVDNSDEPARQRMKLSASNGTTEEVAEQSDRSDAKDSHRRSSTLPKDSVPVLFDSTLQSSVRMDRLDTQDRASLKRKVNRAVRDWESAMESQQYGLAKFTASFSTRLRSAYIHPTSNRGRDTRFDHVLNEFIIRHPEFTSYVAKPSLLRLITQEQYMFVKDEQPWELLCRSQSKHTPPTSSKYSSTPINTAVSRPPTQSTELPGETFMNNIVEAYCCLHTPSERPSAAEYTDPPVDSSSDRPARAKRVPEAEYELARLAAYFLNFFGERERVAHVERLVRASTGVGSANSGAENRVFVEVKDTTSTGIDTRAGQEDTLECLGLYYGDAVVESCIRRMLRSIIRYELERRHDTFIQRILVRKVVSLVSDMFDCERTIDRFAGTELLLTWAAEIRLHFLDESNLDRDDLLRSLLVSHDSPGGIRIETQAHAPQQHTSSVSGRFNDSSANDCVQTLLLHVMLPGEPSRVTSRPVPPALRQWLKQILVPNILDLLPRKHNTDLVQELFTSMSMSEFTQHDGLKASRIKVENTVQSSTTAPVGGSGSKTHDRIHSRAVCALEILLTNESLFRAISTEDACACCTRLPASARASRLVGSSSEGGKQGKIHNQQDARRGSASYARRERRLSKQSEKDDFSSQLHAANGTRKPLINQRVPKGQNNTTYFVGRDNSFGPRNSRESSAAVDGLTSGTGARAMDAFRMNDLAYQVLNVSSSRGIVPNSTHNNEPMGIPEKARRVRCRRQCTCCINLEYLLGCVATHCDLAQKQLVFHTWLSLWEMMIQEGSAPWSYLVTMVTVLKRPSVPASDSGLEDESLQLDAYFKQEISDLIVGAFKRAAHSTDASQGACRAHISAEDLLKYLVTGSGGTPRVSEVLVRCARLLLVDGGSEGGNGNTQDDDSSHSSAVDLFLCTMRRCLRQTIVSSISFGTSTSMMELSQLAASKFGALSSCEFDLGVVQQGRGCLYTPWSTDMTMSTLRALSAFIHCTDSKVRHFGKRLLSARLHGVVCDDSTETKATYVWQLFIRLMKDSSAEVRLMAVKVLEGFIDVDNSHNIASGEIVALFVARFAEETSTLVLHSLRRLLRCVCALEVDNIRKECVSDSPWPITESSAVADAYVSATLKYLDELVAYAGVVEAKQVDAAVDRLSGMTVQLVLVHPSIQVEIFKYVTSRLTATLEIGLWLKFVMALITQAIAQNVSSDTLDNTDNNRILDDCIWAALEYLGREGLEPHTRIQLYRLAYLSTPRSSVCDLLLAHKLPGLVTGCCASDESIRAVCVATLEKLYRHNNAFSKTKLDSYLQRKASIGYQSIIEKPVINAAVVQELARQIRSGDAVRGSHLRMAWKHISDRKLTKYAA